METLQANHAQVEPRRTARALGDRVRVALIVAIQLSICYVPQDSAVSAQNPAGSATEYNLKLARIYATSKFITWPDESTAPGTPFVIGVLAPDPFQGGLKKLAERKLKDRPIEVVVFKLADEYRACHILFIPSESDSKVAADILAQTADAPVLVFCDRNDPKLTTGVACTFVRQGDKLLTETDPAELKRRHLVAEAQLLSLNIIRLVKPSQR